ncbi:MAG: Fe-S cluster assembly protein SufD, partial [Cyanobacteria bacterium P01_C01_bin.73]
MPTQTAAKRDAYLKQLLTNGAGQFAAGLELTELRTAAQALVREQTFPSTRDEEWRFTDLSSLLETDFQVPKAMTPAVSALDLAQLSLAEDLAKSRLVFVNGAFVAGLSSVAGLPTSVTLTNLSSLYTESHSIESQWQAQVMSKLAQVPGNHEVFTALNTASFWDTAV